MRVAKKLDFLHFLDEAFLKMLHYEIEESHSTAKSTEQLDGNN